MGRFSRPRRGLRPEGEYLAAQKSYDRALALKPGDPTVLSNAALSHMQTGDLDGAEKLLLQASPFSAEFPRIASNLALVRASRRRARLRPFGRRSQRTHAHCGPAQAELPSVPAVPVAILPIAEPKIAMPEDLPIAEPFGPRAFHSAAAPDRCRDPPDHTRMSRRRRQRVRAIAHGPDVYVQPLPVRRSADAVKPKPAAAFPPRPAMP